MGAIDRLGVMKKFMLVDHKPNLKFRIVQAQQIQVGRIASLQLPIADQHGLEIRSVYPDFVANVGKHFFAITKVV